MHSIIMYRDIGVQKFFTNFGNCLSIIFVREMYHAAENFTVSI